MTDNGSRGAYLSDPQVFQYEQHNLNCHQRVVMTCLHKYIHHARLFRLGHFCLPVNAYICVLKSSLGGDSNQTNPLHCAAMQASPQGRRPIYNLIYNDNKSLRAECSIMTSNVIIYARRRLLHQVFCSFDFRIELSVVETVGVGPLHRLSVMSIGQNRPHRNHGATVLQNRGTLGTTYSDWYHGATELWKCITGIPVGDTETVLDLIYDTVPLVYSHLKLNDHCAEPSAQIHCCPQTASILMDCAAMQG